MSDDLTDRGPADAARVALSQPWEVAYRCRVWNCTEDELREAVAAVGVMVADVEAHLAKRCG